MISEYRGRKRIKSFCYDSQVVLDEPSLEYLHNHIHWAAAMHIRMILKWMVSCCKNGVTT